MTALRARVIPKYPRIVQGTGGVTVTEQNGTATIGFDYTTSELGAELTQAVSNATAEAGTATTQAGIATAQAAIATAAQEAASAATSTTPVPNTAALAALNPAVKKSAVIYNDGDRNGHFVWTSANVSSFVTADTEKGYYVPLDTDTGAATGIATDGTQGAWVRLREYGLINVRHLGAVGDGTTSDQPALDCAKALALLMPNSTIYLPEAPDTNAGYRGSLVFTDVTSGITIKGDGYKRSRLTYIPGSGNHAVSISDSLGGANTGGTANFRIEDIHLNGQAGLPYNTTGLQIALFVRNCQNFTMNNVEWFGTAWIYGTQGGPCISCWGYGSPALILGTYDTTISDNAPFCFIGGQISNQSGTIQQTVGACMALGDVEVEFYSTMFSASPCPWTIQCDGLAIERPLYNSRLALYDCHSESTFSNDSAGVTIDVAPNNKFGQVMVKGGSWFGQGDGTHRQSAFIRIGDGGLANLQLDFPDVEVLGTSGFTDGIIDNANASWPAATDTVEIKVNNPDSLPVFSGVSGSKLMIPADGTPIVFPTPERTYTGTATINTTYTTVAFGMTFAAAPIFWVQPINTVSPVYASVSEISTTTTTGAAAASTAGTLVRWFAKGIRVA